MKTNEYFIRMNYKFYINYCRLSGSDPIDSKHPFEHSDVNWWLHRRMDKEYMGKAIKIGSTVSAPTIPILNRHSKLIKRITEDLK